MNWLRLILIGVAVLLFCWAAYAVWCAVNNPAFWWSAASKIVAAISAALLPLILKSSLATQARAKDDARRNIERTASGREREH